MTDRTKSRRRKTDEIKFELLVLSVQWRAINLVAKYKSLFFYFLLFLLIASILGIPQYLYYNNLHSTIVNNAETWGQYGDFIGGITNPILAVINIVALIYLTRTVSKSDDKRILNEFRYQAYIDLKDNLNKSKEHGRGYYETLVLNLISIKKTFEDFENHSAFLFESERLRKRISVLIEIVDDRISTIKEIIGINFSNITPVKVDKDGDTKLTEEEFIDLLVSEILSEMQLKILK